MKELITKFYNIINRHDNCCYAALAEDCAKLAENEAIEFAEWIKIYYSMDEYENWYSYIDNKIKLHTTQELFKLYKNERKTN